LAIAYFLTFLGGADPSASGVGASALAPHRQAAAMTDAAVAAEVHQALDVHRGLAAQVAFDDDPGHLAAQLLHLRLGQVANLGVRGNACRVADFLRARVADPIDMGQRDDCVLVGWDVDPGNTGH
jgi:hypothetical protein